LREGWACKIPLDFGEASACFNRASDLIVNDLFTFALAKDGVNIWDLRLQVISERCGVLDSVIEPHIFSPYSVLNVLN
jgi:hypothetical protein